MIWIIFQPFIIIKTPKVIAVINFIANTQMQQKIIQLFLAVFPGSQFSFLMITLSVLKSLYPKQKTLGWGLRNCKQHCSDVTRSWMKMCLHGCSCLVGGSGERSYNEIIVEFGICTWLFMLLKKIILSFCLNEMMMPVKYTWIIFHWLTDINNRKYRDYVYRKMLVQEYLKKWRIFKRVKPNIE